MTVEGRHVDIGFLVIVDLNVCNVLVIIVVQNLAVLVPGDLELSFNGLICFTAIGDRAKRMFMLGEHAMAWRA